MFYYLLSKTGIALFNYITFRAIMGAFTSFIISFIAYPKVIRYFKFKGLGEAAKEDAPENHMQKAGTPTMGGIVIIFSVIISTLLWARIDNRYVIAAILFMISFSLIGFIDDSIKLRFKRYRDSFLSNKEQDWLKTYEESENSNILTGENNNIKMKKFISLLIEFTGKEINTKNYRETNIEEERREIYKEIKEEIHKLYFIKESKEQIKNIKKIWQEKSLTYKKWDDFLHKTNNSSLVIEDFQNEIIYFLEAKYIRKYDENLKLDKITNKWYNWINIPYARQELSRQKNKWRQEVREKYKKSSNFMIKFDGLGAKFRLLLEISITLSIFTTLIFFFNLSTLVQVPFFKTFTHDWGVVVFLIFTTIVVVGFSNAVNLTDGLDGLAAGTMSISMGALSVFIYISGHYEIAKYLNIIHIKDLSELTIFAVSVTASSMAFVWYNASPASIFMGDVGSLGLGASYGSLLVMSKNEFIGVVLGGIFVVETLSVMIQVFVYKKFKKRVFRMSPIHHHFEKMGIKESKIVTRFYLVGIILALISVLSLKIR